MDLLQSVQTFLGDTGVAQLFANGPEGAIKTLIMIAIAGVLIYLAIGKGFEPLLLLPIAIGMLLTNIPGVDLFHSEWYMTEGTIDYLHILNKGELLDILYIGVKTGLYPCLIFIGIGAMTDFTPLISNPKSLLIGAGAQLGVFVAFSGAIFLGFSVLEAASIGIIGGADGPTAIYVTKTLAPALLGAIAVAAYSYMALIPMIQPPIMRLLTTEKERKIKMTALRPVSKLEKMIFPVMVTVVVGMIVPSALSLIGCLMFGNILNVCGVTDRLSKTVQNGLMNAVTVCLGISVGATATAESFLAPETLLIIVLGLTAFTISTIGGLLTAKIMNKLSGGTINPLIGSAVAAGVLLACFG